MIGDEVVVEDDAEVDAEDEVILTTEEIESINNMERGEKNEYIKNMSPEKRNYYIRSRGTVFPGPPEGKLREDSPAVPPPGGLELQNLAGLADKVPVSPPTPPEEYEAFSTPPPPPETDNTDGPVVDEIPEDVDTPDDGLLAGVKENDYDDTGSETVEDVGSGSEEDNAERKDDDAKNDEEEEELVVEDVESDEAESE